MSCDAGKATEGLENELWRRWRVGKFGEWVELRDIQQSSFSNPSVASPTSQLILQPFRCFTYVTVHSPTLPSLLLRYSRAHSPTFPSLHLRHSSFSNTSVAPPTLQQSSFSNLSVTLPTSHLILQPFRRFTDVTAHSPTLYLLHLRHSSFPNPSGASPTSRFILQPFRCFTYVTAHSPILSLLHLRHSSFSNPFVASPTSQLILQAFFCFPYVIGSSLTPPGEAPMAWLQINELKLRDVIVIGTIRTKCKFAALYYNVTGC